MTVLQKTKYKTNEFIFFETDIESHFFVIESGSVTIFTKNSRGEKIVLADLGPGEIFGEQALIDKSERSATAQAKTDCVLVKISEPEYQALLKELPVWASSMLKSFSSRLKQMNKMIKDKNK